MWEQSCWKKTLLSLMGERLCFCLLLRMATNRILTPWVCETESNGVFFYIYTREMMRMVSILDFLGYICTLLLIGSSHWVIVKPIRYRPCMSHLWAQRSCIKSMYESLKWALIAICKREKKQCYFQSVAFV